MKQFDSPETISTAIRKDFVEKNLRLCDVARKVGVTPRLVSLNINGKTYMTVKTAKRYAEALGYNLEYLTSGYGSLYSEPAETEEEEKGTDISDLLSIIASQQQTIQKLTLKLIGG